MSDVVDKRLEIVQNRINQYGMRFPVANIAGRIKFDRGYISSVLNGKKPMSDNFWSKFNEAFPDKTEKRLTPEVQQTDNTGTSFATPQMATLLQQLMQKQNQLMEMQNKILAEQKEDLIERVKEIHTNSKSTIAYLQTILRVNRADDAVIMDNQDAQAGREVGSSAMQAGNLEIAAAQDQVKKDMKKQHGAHK